MTSNVVYSQIDTGPLGQTGVTSNVVYSQMEGAKHAVYEEEVVKPLDQRMRTRCWADILNSDRACQVYTDTRLGLCLKHEREIFGERTSVR